jgi:DNA repair protein RecO (recombination protein O)
MPTQVSEAFILRTYPYREGDLIVSFFTRDQGKLRGVARRARKPKSSFGSGLERLSHVRMTYFLRENAELASLSSCETLESGFQARSDYDGSLALDYVAEVTEQLLAAHEGNERFFRLLLSIVAHLQGEGSHWAAIDYFTLWAVRLSGVLPEVHVDDATALRVQQMFSAPVGELEQVGWTKATMPQLRRRMVRAIEEQVERRLLTVPLLEAL